MLFNASMLFYVCANKWKIWNPNGKRFVPCPAKFSLPLWFGRIYDDKHEAQNTGSNKCRYSFSRSSDYSNLKLIVVAVFASKLACLKGSKNWLRSLYLPCLCYPLQCLVVWWVLWFLWNSRASESQYRGKHPKWLTCMSFGVSYELKSGYISYGKTLASGSFASSTLEIASI